jgi:hypothetical protein
MNRFTFLSVIAILGVALTAAPAASAKVTSTCFTQSNGKLHAIVEADETVETAGFEAQWSGPNAPLGKQVPLKKVGEGVYEGEIPLSDTDSGYSWQMTYALGTKEPPTIETKDVPGATGAASECAKPAADSESGGASSSESSEDSDGLSAALIALIVAIVAALLAAAFLVMRGRGNESGGGKVGDALDELTIDDRIEPRVGVGYQLGDKALQKANTGGLTSQLLEIEDDLDERPGSSPHSEPTSKPLTADDLPEFEQAPPAEEAPVDDDPAM